MVLPGRNLKCTFEYPAAKALGLAFRSAANPQLQIRLILNTKISGHF